MDEAAGGVIFRPHTEEDLPFLMDSWASSYFKGSRAHAKLSPDEFHAFHRPIRERFFAKPNTCVIVCAAESDQWHILGWVAVEQIPSGLVLQYLYVKSAFKAQGIAAQLMARALPSTPVYFTHLTERAARIMARKHDRFREFIHVPHLV